MNTLLELPADQASLRSAERQANSLHRILAVDDDEAVLQLSMGILLRSGYEVDAAKDGADGWTALQARNYDLLITDNTMPRLSGVELVKKMRSARMTLPVILVSGALPTEELDRNPWLHLAAMLQKPINMAELLNTVKEVLRESRPRRRQMEPLLQ